jgi:hypothetical protein
LFHHGDYPFQIVHIDILGPFSRTERDNIYVLVAICGIPVIAN